MNNDRLPHILLHGYTHGSRITGTPKKKWIVSVVEDCVARNISLHQATELARDRISREALFVKRVAGVQGLLHCRQGIK